MTPWQECSIFRYTIFTHDQSFSYFCQFKCKGLIQPTNHSKCLPLNLCDGFEWRWGNSGGCWLTKMVLNLQTTVWQPKMVKFFHVVLNSKNKWLCCVSISGCVPRHFLSGLKLERNNYGSVIIKQNETTRCVLLPSLQIHLISLPYLCFFFRTQRIMGRQWAKIRTVGEVGVVSHSHAELTDEGHMQHPKKVWF